MAASVRRYIDRTTRTVDAFGSGLGIGIGLSVAFATEAFSVGAQVIGLQAGYSFASTVDPQTQADSTVLVVLAQLAAGLLFFSMGMDRDIIRSSRAASSSNLRDLCAFTECGGGRICRAVL